jgi:hypothetical protein
MKTRDMARKDWLKSWMNNEVCDIMKRDKVNMINNSEMQTEEVSKLHKIIEKF